MGKTYGKQSIGGQTGHCFSVIADPGATKAHPVGVTIDWDAVEAVEEDTTLVDGTIVYTGQKYLRYGQVIVKDDDKWVPWSGGAMLRSEVAIIAKTVIQTAAQRGLVEPTSDHPHAIDGGLVWKDRLLADLNPDDSGGKQQETATVAGGPITTSGNVAVIFTANNVTGSPLTTQVAVLQGTAQVETATVVGTIGVAGAGNVEVIVTGAEIVGSPLTIPVAVANDDTASDVAGKIRTALGLEDAITDFYTVGGAAANVSLTHVSPFTANDATLNISIDNGTATGLTPDLSSTDTTAGVAADSAAAVGGKIRTALDLVSAITDKFVISGSGANVIATATENLPNDATLNISIDDNTSAGLTAAPTSANTTSGLAASSGPAIAVLEAAMPLLRYA